MRSTLLLLLTLLCATGLVAQSLLRQLADEVCECLSDANIVYPRIQADKCMQDVANAHPQRIQEELRLTVTRAGDRRRLGELLIDPLAEHCSVLGELMREEPEPELRYSDIGLLRSRPRPLAEKGPPAKSADSHVEHLPDLRRASGVLRELGRNDMLVALPDGGTLSLRYQSRQVRRVNPRAGDRVDVAYFLDWTTDAERVIPTLSELRAD